MAKDLITIATCDPCAEDGLGDVTAVATHVISIDGRPATEIDVCARDSRTVRWFLHVCQERGREIEHKEARLAKAAKTRERKELEKAPAEEEAKTPSVVAEQKKRKRKAPQLLYIVCTETDHKSGQSQRVSYQNRTSHVEQCHKGSRIWDIVWDDPEGHMKHPCTAHAECTKTGLAFTTAKGVSHHIQATKLPRIDIEPGVSEEAP